MHTVALNGQLDANMQIQCNRCGQEFSRVLHTPVALILSDQVQKCEDLDTIECLDATIDLKSILQSEAQNLLCGYHYCDRCDANKEFEITL